jgi:hypothetical protein
LGNGFDRLKKVDGGAEPASLIKRCKLNDKGQKSLFYCIPLPEFVNALEKGKKIA